MAEIDDAFYNLTVAQRDAAWAEAARYRAALEAIAHYTLDLTSLDPDGQAAAAFWTVQRIAERALDTVLSPPPGEAP